MKVALNLFITRNCSFNHSLLALLKLKIFSNKPDNICIDQYMKRFITQSLMNNLHKKKDVYELTRLNNLFTRNEINIPGFDDYRVLKCDFHTHTVFSDGLVWPDGRIYEAWQDGLDAIAITDHIEHRINQDLLNGDLNQSYKIAKTAADDMDLIVIPGVEITRDKPLGHFNALFIQDANLIEKEDPLDSLAEAKKQGAFIVWNHPGWPDNNVTLYPIHEQLITKGIINGIEVMNYKDFYPKAINWCVSFKKTIMAGSDVHCTNSGMYRNRFRPMTLVFAREKSEAGIHEALLARRTIALFDGYMAGEIQILSQFVKSCIKIKYMKNSCIAVTNVSDIPFHIFNEDDSYMLPERKTIMMRIPANHLWTLENCFVKEDSKLSISINELRLQ